MLVNLPYLEKDEECYCGSYVYNDTESPDFWAYNGYSILISEEGLFELYNTDWGENVTPKLNCIKTFDTLKEAILYVKNLKQNENNKNCK